MAFVTLSFKSDFDRLRARLDDLGRRQLPFAAAMALNDTARLVKAQETAALSSVFDRPTPFTLRSIGIAAARKSKLEARVFVKDIQAGYLRLEETGGEREPEPKKPIVVPVDGKRDRYGGLGRGALRRLKGRPDVFVGTVGGVTGFWRRLPRHGLQLLAMVKPEARYRPRFGYRARAEAAARNGFATFLPKRLAEAIASAK